MAVLVSSGAVVDCRGANPVSDPDDVNHFSDLMHAHNVCAAEYAGRDSRSRGPFPLGRHLLSDSGGQERFAGWTAENRSIEGLQGVEFREDLVGVLGSFRKAETRIDDNRVPRHTGVDGASWTSKSE